MPMKKQGFKRPNWDDEGFKRPKEWRERASCSRILRMMILVFEVGSGGFMVIFGYLRKNGVDKKL